MGLRKEIEGLIERGYAEGKDGAKIAQRLVEAGLRMMYDEGLIDENSRIAPDQDDPENGAFFLTKFHRGDMQESIEEDAEDETDLNLLRAAFGEMTISDGDEFLVQINEDGSGFSVVKVRTGSLVDMLRRAGETFNDYALMHIAKGTADGNFKARKNAEMANMCFETIGEAYAMPEIAAAEPAQSDSDVEGTPVALLPAVDALRCPQDVYDYICSVRDTAKKQKQDYWRVLDTVAEQLALGLYDTPVNFEHSLRELINYIGAANVKAGWWNEANIDLRDCGYTGHVVLGKLGLVNSEVGEAMEGWRKSQKQTILMDDKLPTRPMLEVELADVVIRVFDLAANVRFKTGRLLDVAGAVVDKLAFNKVRPDHQPEARAGENGKAM
jgi:NTP pyrophosphatase (non-canonical NTP hydrolase)